MKTILPGATLGVLGSGQLGRMFALAAREMGYGVHTYSNKENSPTGHVADREFVGQYDDIDRIREFAKTVSVVTFEFENVSAEAAQAIEAVVPVRPGGEVLHISQNRNREKSTLAKAGLPVTPFRLVTCVEDMHRACSELPGPAILKTAFGGYDGKGQIAINGLQECEAAWQELGTVEAVYEQKIDFVAEVSVVAVRGLDGEIICCGPIENDHQNHILDVSLFPASSELEIAEPAKQIARGVMETLDVIGVMCIEMFVQQEGGLLINEVAPRPHNSGHLTIEACVSSQFEQQVRAICGLPLGNMDSLKPAAMANILGELWKPKTPDWEAAIRVPHTRLHLYGKQEPRAGRKMGHLTSLGDTIGAAKERVLTARAGLSGQA